MTDNERLLKENETLRSVNAENERLIRQLWKERDCFLALLKESKLTHEMWKDVAPAISLCADIEMVIAKAMP